MCYQVELPLRKWKVQWIDTIVKVWNQKTNKVRSCLGFPVVTSSVFEPFSHLQCNMLDVATVSRSKKWDYGTTYDVRQSITKQSKIMPVLSELALLEEWP